MRTDEISISVSSVTSHESSEGNGASSSSSSGYNLRPTKKQKISNMLSIAAVGDRYGLSDRALTAASSATLEGDQTISKSDLSKVIDKNKVRRARKKLVLI